MQFKEIYGQEHIKQSLLTQLKSDRFHHAHLFLGKMGHGTLGLALAAIQYLYCLAPTPEDSCGECINCIKNNKIQHPDVHYTFPSFDDKNLSPALLKEFINILKEKGCYIDKKDWLEFNDSKNLKIRSKDIALIFNTFDYSSVEGGARTQVIWLAEYMEKESNKILKVLEEPPQNSFFFLIAESADNILPTILSRCNIHKILPYSSDDIQTYGSEVYPQLEPNILKQASEFSNGDLIALRRYIEDVGNTLSVESIAIDILRGLVNFEYRKAENLFNLFSTIDSIDSLAKKSREVPVLILNYMAYFFREVLRYQVFNTTKMTDKLKNAVAFYAKIYEIDQLEWILEQIEETIYSIERNVDTKISFVSLCLGLGKAQKRKDFANLSLNNW